LAARSRILTTFGQLGDGTINNCSLPVDVISLGGDATSVANGEMHTCALLTSGAVRCWGEGAGG